MRCPVCNTENKKKSLDICDVCFWEYDPTADDEASGANSLCLNDYKRLWEKLNSVMPGIMDKYGVSKDKGIADWRYSNLKVPREHIREFVAELTKQNIPISLNFYNICREKHWELSTFCGYPRIEVGRPFSKSTVAENNNEAINIVFAKDPVSVCQKYSLLQLENYLKNSENISKTWEELTPLIDIEMSKRCGEI